MTTYPIQLRLGGRAVLVVGGGGVATRKVAGLLAAGAQVRVVAPEISLELESRPVTIVRRPYQRGDIANAELVFIAISDTEVAQQIYEDAVAARIWVNAADDPARCTFILPAVVRRDPVTISVSTDGASPALASWLRRWLERTLPADLGRIANKLNDERRSLHASGISTESVSWDDCIAQALAGLTS